MTIFNLDYRMLLHYHKETEKSSVQLQSVTLFKETVQCTMEDNVVLANQALKLLIFSELQITSEYAHLLQMLHKLRGANC